MLLNYVCPIVEVNTSVWFRSHVHSINLVDVVQRQFTRRILPNLSHHDRPLFLNLQSYEERSGLNLICVNYFMFCILLNMI